MDDVIVDIVDATLQSIKKLNLKEFAKYMPPRQLVHEFKSLRLRVPRGLGTTSAAVQLLMKYNKSNLFVFNEDHKRKITRNIIPDRVYNIQLDAQQHLIGNKNFRNLDVLVFDTMTAMEREPKLLKKIEELEIRLWDEVKLFVYLG